MDEAIRVLLIEDLSTDAELAEREVRQVLARCAFRCVETREEYLTALETFRPNLILSDYKLPQFDGLAALQLAQEHAPGIPFILVTGSMDEDTAVESMKAGAWDYVIKEHIKRLGPAVLGALDRSRRLRAQQEAQARALLRQQEITLFWQSLLASAPLEEKLKRTTDTIIRLFCADFCRIWLAQPADLCQRGCFHAQAVDGPHACLRRDQCLHLLASSGRYTHTDGKAHSRVPLGAYKIGTIASGGDHKLISNDVQDDPHVHDHAWARELGLVSFAGYQIRVPGGDPLGVLALFAKHPILPEEDAILDGLSSSVALVVQRAVAEAERDAAEAAMRQAQKMEAVGRLAGGVAHDFNNLLMIILGQAEIATAHLGPDDPLQPRLQDIVDAGDRATNLTRQLLAFARQEVVCPRSLDLNEAVSGMETMLRRLIGEDLELHWKPGADVWPVYLDPCQVDQLLANLVVNARDAIPDTGTVTIETATAVLDGSYCAIHLGATPGEHAVLTVSDTGVGMDRETQARIFEPFFTTKERGKGTGLGLATVYGIVKQAGGSVYVYSEPGQGTIFRLYLPRWQGGETAAVLQAAPPQSSWGDETVLVVEDEVAILQLGHTALERQGYRVLTADTPAAALLAAEQEPGEIHLLATDVVMPGMNGRELYERLQARQPGLKCLYLSGYTADVISQRGVLPEGVNFLQKPFTLKSLAEKVRAVLDS